MKSTLFVDKNGNKHEIYSFFVNNRCFNNGLSDGVFGLELHGEPVYADIIRPWHATEPDFYGLVICHGEEGRSGVFGVKFFPDRFGCELVHESRLGER